MPPLLCPSPRMLDHSFPQSDAELSSIALALGQLELVVQRQEGVIAITGTMRDFLEMFEWQGNGGLLSEIYRYCSLLFLVGGSGKASVSVVPAVADGEPRRHPAPANTVQSALTDYWREELGAIFAMHESVTKKGSPPFIGVACASQFSGADSPGYETEDVKHFDLVGPRQLETLDDAFGWDVPAAATAQKVSFADAYRNLPALGCTSIDNPSGGSHYKANFAGKRPWILDPNTDPIPDRFLGELEHITGLPTAVVKHTLKTGSLPPRRLRI